MILLFDRKEKASLLEKVEHYERDLQPSSNKSSEKRVHKSADSDCINDYEDFQNDVQTNYEFYYEKNLRP
jgi:hypothetical protein